MLSCVCRLVLKLWRLVGLNCMFGLLGRIWWLLFVLVLMMFSVFSVCWR